MDYAAKIAGLRQQAADIDARLAELADKRRTFALGVMENNRASVKAVEELDAETDQLRKKHRTCLDASEHAERLQRDEQAEIARKDRLRRTTMARELSQGVLTLNVELDEDLKKLSEKFEHRAGLIKQLSATRTVASTTILRLLQKFSPTAAARAAGLHQFLSLEPVAPPHVMSLAKGTSGLLRQPKSVDVEDNGREREQPAA